MGQVRIPGTSMHGVHCKTPEHGSDGRIRGPFRFSRCRRPETDIRTVKAVSLGEPCRRSGEYSHPENAPLVEKTLGMSPHRMRRARLAARAILAAVALVTGRPAAAHHSYAMFDASRKITLHGTL